MEWVRENVTLWHSKRQNFRDTAKKMGMWHDKGLEVGYSGEHLKGWWTHMRDTYTRLQKPKSGQSTAVLTDRQKWITENLQFLKHVVRHRGAPVRPIHTATAAATLDPMEILEQEAKEASQLEEADSTNSAAPRKKAKKPAADSQELERVEDLLQRSHDLLQRLVEKAVT